MWLQNKYFVLTLMMLFITIILGCNNRDKPEFIMPKKRIYISDFKTKVPFNVNEFKVEDIDIENKDIIVTYSKNDIKFSVRADYDTLKTTVCDNGYELLETIGRKYNCNTKENILKSSVAELILELEDYDFQDGDKIVIEYD